MVRWRMGISRPCPAPHGHGIATSEVNMGIIVKFSEALPRAKKPRFAHGRGNLRDDVSGKRFITHVMELNVARIGDGGCGNNKVTASAAGE